jgi:hypothetical protein
VEQLLLQISFDVNLSRFDSSEILPQEKQIDAKFCVNVFPSQLSASNSKNEISL